VEEDESENSLFEMKQFDSEWFDSVVSDVDLNKLIYSLDQLKKVNDEMRIDFTEMVQVLVEMSELVDAKAFEFTKKIEESNERNQA